MPALVIDSSVNLDVQSFVENEPRERGSVKPSFNNTLRSAVSDDKRNFQAVTAPFDDTTRDALRAAIANRAPVDVTGDCLDGDTVTCSITARIEMFGTSFSSLQYVATLNMQEV